MAGVGPHLGSDVNLARWGRAVVVVVVVVAALDWVGWATGVEGLTRVYRTWPQMVPWTALWLSGLGVAILVQTGCRHGGLLVSDRGAQLDRGGSAAGKARPGR